MLSGKQEYYNRKDEESSTKPYDEMTATKNMDVRFHIMSPCPISMNRF